MYLIKYLGYLLKHKYYVFIGGLKYKVPLWILILHDWDKFLPYNFLPYAQFNYGNKIRNDALNEAWNRHQKTNKHHYEYWIFYNPHSFCDGVDDTLKIPDVYIREMLADWYGAGYSRNSKINEKMWYERNKNCMKIHPESRLILERLLYEK